MLWSFKLKLNKKMWERGFSRSPCHLLCVCLSVEMHCTKTYLQHFGMSWLELWGKNIPDDRAMHLDRCLWTIVNQHVIELMTWAPFVLRVWSGSLNLIEKASADWQFFHHFLVVPFPWVCCCDALKRIITVQVTASAASNHSHTQNCTNLKLWLPQMNWMRPTLCTTLMDLCTFGKQRGNTKTMRTVNNQEDMWALAMTGLSTGQFKIWKTAWKELTGLAVWKQHGPLDTCGGLKLLWMENTSS